MRILRTLETKLKFYLLRENQIIALKKISETKYAGFGRNSFPEVAKVN